MSPRGCGKTTLLRLISGLKTPDPGGAVRFNGEDVTLLSIERRTVSVVFQSHALSPNMSMCDNIAYGFKVRKIDKDEIVVHTRKMLEMMQIGQLAERLSTSFPAASASASRWRAIGVRLRGALLLDELLVALGRGAARPSAC